MGINSITNAISTLGDESASVGQKLTATAMALTTGFAMIKTVITGVTGAISILNARTIDSATASAAVVAAKKLEAGAEGELAAQKSSNILISGLANAKNKEEVASVLTKIGVKNAEALAEEFLTIQKEKGTVAAIKATKLKVNAKIQDDQDRVSGAKKDDLQAVIQMLKAGDFGVDLQFINMR